MNNLSTRRIIETASGSLFPNYKQFPIVLKKGEGTRVWDTDGNEYVDFVAGIATCNLGHCHPEVVKAICEQAGRLIHVSNWYYSDVQAELSRELTSLTALDRVFFCNSGAEASEAAIKAARKRAFDKYGPNRSRIIGFHGAFHGRTMKALTATDPRHHIEAFSPYPEGFVHISAGDIQELERHLPGACAVFLEPVQGEGGVRPLDSGFLLETARLCREHDVLIMLDEVQTGMGRCGALFAHQVLGIEPDIMTLAKGLANGFPMGSVLARDEIAQALGPGTHGSTFGGNALACAASLATLRVLTRDDLPSRAAAMGDLLRKGLEKIATRHPSVKEVRGMGLLLGMELTTPVGPVVKNLMDHGFLVTAVAENTLRFTPALTISPEEIQDLLDALEKSISASGGSNP
jgi:predicted acetylornithine/succinylornithine family transaminase